MNQILSKFNLYDQLAYLLVGSVALMTIYGNSLLLNVKIPDFNLANSPLWFIVSYFAGHIIHAIGNIIIREKKDNFTENEKEILKSARVFLKQETISDSETWNLCFMLTTAKDATGQIQAFNAYYSLYRGWIVIFIIESVFMSIMTISSFSFYILFLLLFCAAITILFYIRLKRFNRYLKDKIFQTFILISSGAY